MSEEAADADGIENTADPDEIEETARAYYEAIDAQNYERFADLLDPGVVHDRPDQTIEGRDSLVEFMRDDRPQKDTSHEIVAVFEGNGEVAVEDGMAVGGRVAVEGRLLDSSGNEMFEFVDIFAFENGNIAEIRTYTR